MPRKKGKTARRKTAKKPPRGDRKASPLRLLFTCIGRRVELLRAFERAAKANRIPFEIHGADATWLAPGMHCVDKAHILPSIASGQYIDAVSELVRKKKIDLLIPLLDIELPLIAAARESLAKLGCRAVISSEEVVRVCRDKLATFQVLRAAGIDTPDTWNWTDAMQLSEHRFPYYLKPRSGSAAMGNYKINNRDELHTFGLRVPDAIVQEFVDGTEHTLDVYTGVDSVPRCAVPRKRLEVRTGEVSKGVIVKDPAIMEVGLQVATTLGDCRGVITVQCMVTSDRRIRVIEINPRFGGGAPLSIHAGADFAQWILLEHLGRRFRINPTGFRDDVALLRFDDSVFVNRASRFAQSGSAAAQGGDTLHAAARRGSVRAIAKSVVVR